MTDRRSLFSRFWNELLKQDEFLLLSRQLGAKLIMTPYDTLLSESDECDVNTVIESLQNNNSNHALFFNRNNCVIGWINQNEPKKLYFSSQNTIAPTLRLSQVLNIVKDRGAALVTNDGEMAGKPLGAVFPEDFNRPAMRSFLFQWILTVEVELMLLIQKIYAEKRDDWLTCLPEARQMEIREEFERTRARETDVELIHLLYFKELVDVLFSVGKCPPILRKKFFYLNSLRNRVMHPVRLLVYDQNDLKLLHQDYGTLKQVISELRETRSDL